MDINSSGTVYAKSQVTDYRARGQKQELFNVVDFFTDTYESNQQAHNNDEAVEEAVNSKTRKDREMSAFLT